MKVISRIIVVVTFACGGSCRTNADDPVLSEALTVHNELSVKFEALHEALRIDSLQHPDSLKAWRKILSELESNMIEVPGDHKHHEGHNHHQVVELTTDQLLAAQLDLQKQLDSLEVRIKRSSR
jgi:hypothetical protein